MSAQAPTATASATAPLLAIAAASAAVLAVCTLASFRLPFAGDPATLLQVNGPRVLFAAAVGACLALSGALRLEAGRVAPLAELRLMAASAAAAGAGLWLAASLGVWAFVPAAVLGAWAASRLVSLADRPARSANFAAAGILLTAIVVAALAGSESGARDDFVKPGVAWLLGDLSGASWPAAAVLAGLAAIGIGLAAGARAGRAASLAWLGMGIGFGAAGLLAFVSTLVPRSVAWLSGAASASPGLRLASALAGAASVAAIDSVPRWLVGGYDFRFNIAAGILAIPIFLGWNRARLRAAHGSARPWLEGLELATLGVLTAAAIAVAAVLTSIIAFAT